MQSESDARVERHWLEGAEGLRMRCSRCRMNVKHYTRCACGALLCTTCTMPFYDGSLRHQCAQSVLPEEVRWVRLRSRVGYDLVGGERVAICSNRSGTMFCNLVGRWTQRATVPVLVLDPIKNGSVATVRIVLVGDE